MNLYLLRMKVNGIKNIDKEIEIEFYNKTLKKTFELNNSNIKSIYGSNGAGKSAIINAVDIYQNLILNENYLSDSQSLRILNELINKRLEKFSFEASYLFYNKQSLEIYDVVTHRIEIAKDGKDQFKVVYEKLVLHSNKSYQDHGKILIEIKNGEIIHSDYKKECKAISMSVMNLLDKQSIASALFNKFQSSSTEYDAQTMYIYRLFQPIVFASNLNVTVNDTDRHTNYFIMQKDLDQIIVNVFENIYIDTGTDLIEKEKFEQYQNHVSKMCKFIQLFKNNLCSIDIDVKEEKMAYVCKKYFNYGDYRVESEFESTGIKKLITLYKAFCDFNNGKIVFIDELDANLHDVYLTKLLEYFSLYGNGQLCFTTHNLAPMEILRKRNYAIDFISDDSTLISWKKNGNFSVSKLYKEGMIQNSPFNIESFDFLGLFD